MPRATAQERELKLAAPPGFDLLGVGPLGDDLVTTAVSDRRLWTIYWDTEDLRLVRWGCTLRHRVGEGWTVKLPNRSAAAAGGALVRVEHSFPGGPSRPPEAATDLVRAYARTATLVPTARLRTVRHAATLRRADGRAVAEIDDDEVSVFSGRRIVARFRELEIEAAEGTSDVRLAAVAERLQAAGAGAVDLRPKLAHALGDRALAAPDVAVLSLGPEATAAEMVTRAVAASVERLLHHDPWIRAGSDPEDVHQARVATRRLRSDLRTFASLLDRAWADDLRDELRWLGGELGAVRDAEVLHDRLGAAASRLPAGEAALGARLVASLAAAITRRRRALLAVMRTERYAALLDRLVAAAAAPALGAGGELPAAGVAAGLVARPWRRLRGAARSLDDDAPAEALHELRIRAKRCRYAAEAVAPVAAPDARRFARAVAALQDVLGTHHDAVVAEAWLRERATGRWATDTRLAFAAGQICAAQRMDAESARTAWPAAWRQAARQELRSWM